MLKRSNSAVSSISYLVLFDRFNLYGLQSLLILYLISCFGFLDKSSYLLYGTYVSLSFALTIVGGIIADRLLGTYLSAVVGASLCVMANIILFVPHLSSVYAGLALMIVGIGLLKPNNPNLLGMIYKEESLERTKAFSIFYIGISLGSITGPMIYGLAYTYKLYWLAFFVSAIGLLSAILFLKKFKYIFSAAPNNYSFSKAALAITLSFFVSLFFIRYNELFGYFISAAAMLGIILAVNFVKKMSSQEQVAISSLLIPIISNIIFLIALLQIYSSITLSIERHVNRQILFGWEIPASWFSTMEPFCILFMVPLLNALWKKLSKRGINLTSHQKVILGLVFACVGFLVVSLITKIVWTNSYVVLLLLFLVNMLLAAGELCIIPVTMSLISLKSPTHYRGTLMGIFYFSLTFSGYLSGLAAKLFPTNASSLPTDYMPLFITISAVLFVTATLLTFLNKLMDKFIDQQTGNIFLSS